MRWWKYFRQSRMKADRFWSEIGISQFLLDLLQFRFPMLWGTEPVPFGTRAIQIWTRSIPVSLPKMRKWNQRRNWRRRRRKPSAITNIRKQVHIPHCLAAEPSKILLFDGLHDLFYQSPSDDPTNMLTFQIYELWAYLPCFSFIRSLDLT